MLRQEAKERQAEGRRRAAAMREITMAREETINDSSTWKELWQQLNNKGFKVCPTMIAGIPSAVPLVLHAVGETWYLFAIRGNE